MEKGTAVFINMTTEVFAEEIHAKKKLGSFPLEESGQSSEGDSVPEWSLNYSLQATEN